MHDFRTLSRTLACLTVAGVLLWQSASVQPGDAVVWSGILLSIFAVAVFATVFLLATDGWRRIERYPDLLVPLALLVGSCGLLDIISQQGLGLATPLFSLPLYYTTVPVSVDLLCKGLLTVLFGLWTTLLVIDVVRADRAELPATFARLRPKYLPFLLLLLLAWVVTTLLFALEIPVLLFLGMGVSRIFGPFGMVAITLMLLSVIVFHFVLNLAAALVLPIAVEDNRGFWARLRYGIAESWRHCGKWWKLLLVQYLLAGAWLVVHYQYTSNGGNSSFNLDFKYFVPWLADYNHDSDWYSRVMEWLGHPPLALATTLWQMLSLLLSLVVKLAIFDRYATEKRAKDMSCIGLN